VVQGDLPLRQKCRNLAVVVGCCCSSCDISLIWLALSPRGYLAASIRAVNFFSQNCLIRPKENPVELVWDHFCLQRVFYMCISVQYLD
jgi:hypothetical protein